MFSYFRQKPFFLLLSSWVCLQNRAVFFSILRLSNQFQKPFFWGVSLKTKPLSLGTFLSPVNPFNPIKIYFFHLPCSWVLLKNPKKEKKQQRQQKKKKNLSFNFRMLASHSLSIQFIQQAIHISLLLVTGFLLLGSVECRNQLMVESFEYPSASCRAHSVSLEDFGGVNDGVTSNTKAFQKAIAHLSQFGSDGGGLLFVPAGRWVTGSFNLTSSFTLFLHRDAVILASQVKILFSFNS